MDFFTFIVWFTVIGVIVVLVASLVCADEVAAKFKRQIQSIPEFSSCIQYISVSCKNAIALDLERKKIAVFLNPIKIRSLETKPIVYPFEDLIAVEVVRDDASVVKTNRGSQAAGAAVGGILLGPAGMLLGGLSGSRREESKIKKLSIKLYTDDLIRPVQEVLFWDSSVGVDVDQIKPIFADLDQWYGRLRVIVERQSRAN